MTRPAFCPDIERVPPGACPQPPPDNEARWAARKPLYDALRNTEKPTADVVPIRRVAG